MCVGGMRMSTIATSGRVSSTRRSSSSAFAALPTTSIPASASRRASPSRKSISSSAITTRMAAPLGSLVPASVARRRRAGRRARRRGPRARRGRGRRDRGLDLDHERAVGLRRPRPRACLRGAPVSATTTYAAVSTGGANRSAGKSPIRDRHARLLGERVDRGARARRRRAPPGRCRARARAAPRSRRRAPASARSRAGTSGCFEPREAKRERERDEPLLRAVVEVALEPPPLGVARLDDARPRRAQLLELRAHLGLQALVLEREPGRGGDLVDELLVVEQAGRVPEHGDVASLPDEARSLLTLAVDRASARRPDGPARAGRRARAPDRRRSRRARRADRRAEATARARRRGARQPTARGGPDPAPADPERDCDERGRLAEPQPPLERAGRDRPRSSETANIAATSSGRRRRRRRRAGSGRPAPALAAASTASASAQPRPR